jgi:hypothetical protein
MFLVNRFVKFLKQLFYVMIYKNIRTFRAPNGLIEELLA